jgi:S-(hydroxymethyl)glutathione dehydrogenase/alcohol dehydrogenase
MKAAVLYETGKLLQIEDLNIAEPKDGEVLMTMTAAGVCASDHHVIHGQIPYPLPIVLGHESAGIVEKVGPNVTNVKPGDACIMSFVSSCSECNYCRTGLGNHCEKHFINNHTHFDGSLRLKNSKNTEIHQMHRLGGFAEQQVVPASSLLVVPKELPPEIAALIGCCVTTGFGGLVNLNNVKTGSTVAVFGCGGVGLNVLQGAKMLNANKIIAVDIFDHKLEFAYKFGATDVINAKNEDPIEKIKEITGGGVDYAFDSFGSAVIMQQAVESLGKRGTAVLVGLARPDAEVKVNMVDLVRNEKNIVGSFYGYGSPLVTMQKIVDMYMLGKLDIDGLVRKVFKLEDINQAFADIEKGEDGRGVIVF